MIGQVLIEHMGDLFEHVLSHGPVGHSRYFVRGGVLDRYVACASKMFPKWLPESFEVNCPPVALQPGANGFVVPVQHARDLQKKKVWERYMVEKQ